MDFTIIVYVEIAYKRVNTTQSLKKNKILFFILGKGLLL